MRKVPAGHQLAQHRNLGRKRVVRPPLVDRHPAVHEHAAGRIWRIEGKDHPVHRNLVPRLGVFEKILR